MIFLQKHTFEKRAYLTIRWLEKSIIRGKGGAASYFGLDGWGAPYPETTGYIIETLLNYSYYFKNNQLKSLAINCADWLCNVQRQDGAFPGGVGTKGNPIIFDTAQILFGLSAIYEVTNEKKYLLTMERAVQWLLEAQEQDGSWQQFAYQEGHPPTYYTRVIWAILATNQVFQNNFITEKMRIALRYYEKKITKQNSVSGWGFLQNEKAFTHTIAYTLEGFLESALLLKELDTLDKTELICKEIMNLYHKKGKIAGRYDEFWKGDYSFLCVTGNAQLSIIFARLFQITGSEVYKYFAFCLFESIANSQCKIPIPALRGAIPGSKPLWGTYMRFRFPNWAAKFYLDAYLILIKISAR